MGGKDVATSIDKRDGPFGDGKVKGLVGAGDTREYESTRIEPALSSNGHIAEGPTVYPGAWTNTSSTSANREIAICHILTNGRYVRLLRREQSLKLGNTR